MKIILILHSIYSEKTETGINQSTEASQLRPPPPYILYLYYISHLEGGQAGFKRSLAVLS